MEVLGTMFDDQLHLLIPIATRLKAAWDKRVNKMIKDEIHRYGIRPFEAEKYRIERLDRLRHYSDEELLRLASELATQLCDRAVTHAPYRLGSSGSGARPGVNNYHSYEVRHEE
jgi:hypothetical protein